MSAIYFEQRGAVYAVRFRYDAALVELIKAAVPWHARSWSPQRREWIIEEFYGKPLADALRRIGCTVIGLEPPQPQHYDDHRWAHMLFKRVGRDRADQITARYRKCFHPDLQGGDARLQRELTDARNDLASKQERSA